MLALATATVFATALHAEAQTAASFEDLSRLLRAGDRVTVTDAHGEDLEGRIIDLSPSTLALEITGNRRYLGAADVSSIRQRRRDPLRNGTLIGIGVGVIPGVLLSAMVHSYANNEGGSPGRAVATSMIFSLGVGAALGAGVDAMIQGSHVIYGPTGAARKRLTVSPLLAADRRGVAVSLGF